MQQVIPDSLNIVLGQQRIADCLKSVNRVGSTLYMDVCNNASYSVPWGSLDWLLALGLGAGALVVLLVLGALAIDIGRF